MELKLLTTREIAKIYSVNIVTVHNWIKSGKLEAHQPIPRGRYYIKNIEFLLNSKHRKAGLRFFVADDTIFLESPDGKVFCECQSSDFDENKIKQAADSFIKNK